MNNSVYNLFFYYAVDHRDLHSFPTRRSSDLTDRRFEQFGEAVLLKAHDAGATARHQRPGAHQRRGQRVTTRSEEHTSELQSHVNLVCRLLLEKKKKNTY